MRRRRDDELIPFYRNEPVFGPLTLVAFIRIVLVLAAACVLTFTFVLWDLNRLSVSNHQLRVAVCGLVKADIGARVTPEQAELVHKYDCKGV